MSYDVTTPADVGEFPQPMKEHVILQFIRKIQHYQIWIHGFHWTGSV